MALSVCPFKQFNTLIWATAANKPGMITRECLCSSAMQIFCSSDLPGCSVRAGTYATDTLCDASDWEKPEARNKKATKGSSAVNFQQARDC